MSTTPRWTVNQNKFDNLQIGDTVEWKDIEGPGWRKGTVYHKFPYGPGGYLVVEEYIVVDYQLVMVHVSQIIGE